VSKITNSTSASRDRAEVGQLQPQPFHGDGATVSPKCRPASENRSGCRAARAAAQAAYLVLQAFVDHADAALEGLGGLEQGEMSTLASTPNSLAK
jgi:hypothetical protein